MHEQHRQHPLFTVVESFPLACLDLYWTNSQYSIILNGDAESRDSLSGKRAGKQNVVIVSLMQKGARRTRTTNRVQMAEAAITFDLYKVDTT